MGNARMPRDLIDVMRDAKAKATSNARQTIDYSYKTVTPLPELGRFILRYSRSILYSFRPDSIIGSLR